MRRLLLIPVLLAAASGCTVAPVAAPVVLDGLPPAVYEQKLAVDVTRQLQTLYPPASTRLSLEAASPSGIGTPLAAELRTAGYSLEDGAGATRSDDARVLADTTRSGIDKTTHPPAVPLRLAFDRVPLSDLFYVTVDAGHRQLSRVYLRQGTELQPAGAWTQGERQ